MIKTCSFILPNDEPCGEICEGRTTMCASHNRFTRREYALMQKQSSKRAAILQKAKEKNKQPRKAISKNPSDWGNTFLCSDGTRVTQEEINGMMIPHRTMMGQACQGCGIKIAVCKAHIIPRARCKVIGKTELIWEPQNMFDSCFNCNSAIENPKGEAWKKLKNINYCLAFIELHDKELFAKFESRLATQTEPHKI